MTTHTSSALQTLIEIASKESLKNAENLSLANHRLHEGQNNLMLLVSYRKDYERKFASNLKTGGVSTESYFNFQSFLGKIDEAILGQQNAVAKFKQEVDYHRKCWQESERKKLSYGVLVSHSEKRAHYLALKRDQKLMDEHAARRSKSHVR
jgi:flagellar FliJ protein